MGGRGSSGGVGGGAIKMPNFTGSAKQISWAQSIIQEGLDTISRNIAREQSQARQNPGYKSFAKDSISAWNSVKKSFTNALSAGAGRYVSASRIIDRQNAFNGSGVLRAYNAELMKIKNRK